MAGAGPMPIAVTTAVAMENETNVSAGDRMSVPPRFGNADAHLPSWIPVGTRLGEAFAGKYPARRALT
jgi:hypothetical protein